MCHLLQVCPTSDSDVRAGINSSTIMERTSLQESVSFMSHMKLHLGLMHPQMAHFPSDFNRDCFISLTLKDRHSFLFVIHYLLILIFRQR
jgi:hypothetical protein